MAISESIKRAVLDLETALAEADTLARALQEATRDGFDGREHDQPSALVDLVGNLVRNLSTACERLISEVHHAARR